MLRARARGPRRRDVQRDEALDALGVGECEEKPHVPAPVVAHEGHPVEVERVEQRAQVVGEPGLVVAVVGHGGPAHPAQVGHDDAMALGERRDEVAPAPAVLRPAVDEDDRRAVARLGDVDVEVAGADRPLTGAGQRGWGHAREHRAARAGG